jgi:hypothetical protein
MLRQLYTNPGPTLQRNCKVTSLANVQAEYKQRHEEKANQLIHLRTVNVVAINKIFTH